MEYKMTRVHIYAPGATPLDDGKGHKCVECYHWQKRKEEENYFNTEDCPCFECAGMGYSVDEELLLFMKRGEYDANQG